MKKRPLKKKFGGCEEERSEKKSPGLKVEEGRVSDEENTPSV